MSENICREFEAGSTTSSHRAVPEMYDVAPCPCSRDAVAKPARADVVPGSIEVEQTIAEMIRSADGKVTASVGLVVHGRTGFQRVNRQYPLWVIQVFRDFASERPLGQALPRTLDVPVRIDPESGKIKGLDLDSLMDELAPHRELAAETWRLERGSLSPACVIADAPRKLSGGLRSLRAEIAAGVADIRRAPPAPTVPRPTAESHPPIEGVDYDTWVLANVAFGRGVATTADRVAFFERSRFPAGRVDDVDAAWWRRAKTDDAVGSWYGHDFQHLDPG